MTAGSFISSPCNLCGKPLKRPLVRVGELVKAGLSWVEGWGMMHPPCARAVQQGTLQAQLFEEGAA